MKTPPWERLSGFVMLHHRGMRAVERMLLDGALPPRALLAFWAIATRAHPISGKAWVTSVEVSAAFGMDPVSAGRHISALKKLGLLVRRKEKPDKKLEPWEIRFLPDPSSRGPHSGRLFMQLHPLLLSVGRASKREKALVEFREAVGGRVTPFEEVLASIEAEDRAAAEELELAQLITREDARQAKLRQLEGHRQQPEQGHDPAAA